MSRFPYVQWYPGDYLSERKTARLELDEHGAYHLLLWAMWQETDEQCIFPMDYSALGGIWRRCPEEAERILGSLLAPGMALLKVVNRRKVPYLFSKRLHEEHERAAQKSARQSQAGKRSGAVRRGKSANHGSTTVQPLLNLSELELESDKTPVSSRSSQVQGSGRGSYPQASEPDASSAKAYWETKLHRSLTPDEIRTVKRWVRTFGAGETKVQIGYALEDGFVDNAHRIGGALKASKARADGGTGRAT